MITDLNKLSIQAIVNVFETGRAHGDYGKVTLLSGDSGHLTYGRSQTTLASGKIGRNSTRSAPWSVMSLVGHEYDRNTRAHYTQG